MSFWCYFISCTGEKNISLLEKITKLEEEKTNLLNRIDELSSKSLSENEFNGKLNNFLFIV